MIDDEWLVKLWHSAALDDRARAIITARAAGRTLDSIGVEHAMSRERVRQILVHEQRGIAAVANLVQHDWSVTARTVGAAPASPRSAFAAALGVHDHVVLEPLLREAGLSAPRTWSGPLHGWWTARPDKLDATLRELTEAAPFRGDELGQTATAAGLPAGLPLAELLADPKSKLALSATGHWVRRKARGRDAAYLRLLEVGRPCDADELIEPMCVSTAAAVREALRRDDRFTQIRPQGTWALVEWSHLRPVQYSNAVEALVAVVTELGPISQAALFSKVTEIYPVTLWRLKQCLLSDQIGETADGFIDLVARGAQPMEEEEPTRPDTMAAEGDVLGVRITVDRDVLRGSGVAMHSWLTWHLGLRQAPMSRTFTTVDNDLPVTVRRRTSGAQVSSLREHALRLEAVEGCVLALLLHLSDQTARISHACAEGACPAGLTRSGAL
ncbi:sigma factor-like helix-turn-helix DNA-binding protein [Streptomyces griseoaurantiacus]|uniref:sigma factor-like helix-turn-helix DNA-binding protein n=1 Tax=Streptomyces griseoaurantiacus TaxID=68213 RepID=UPI0019A8BCC1|nr:hypothetical protein GCM10018782_44080 [Streptomyces griseoaurantiacus]